MAGSYFTLKDLRGGINDSDSPFAIAEDQVTAALNVDYREGMIGTKRKGLTALSMANSVFSRDVPTLQVSNQGGWAGAAGGTLAIGAGTNTDGTGATNHILIVRIATKAATDVTAVDLSGTGLTNLGQVTNGLAGRLEVFYLNAPAIGGGTLNVTLAGAADCAIVAERWIYCDPVAPANFASVSATTVVAFISSNAWNPQYLAQMAFAWTFTAAAFSQGPGVIVQTQQANGNARVLGASMIGMKPTSEFETGLNAVVDCVSFIWGLRGRVAVPATSTVRVMTLMHHQPTNKLVDDELWAQDNFGRLDRYVGGAWQTGVPTVNWAVGSFGSNGSAATNGVSLHGKFFIALDGDSLTANRLVVWDGTVLRWAGLSMNTGFTVANRAGAGTFAGTRYYRIRLIEQVGTTITRRSEPSAVTIFAPSGANTGATITKGAAPGFVGGEGETHWELEASIDNTLFYRIGTATIATGTQDDTAAGAGTGTYAAFPLSENIGEYVVPYAPRHVTVDQDRLLMAGSLLTPVLDSRVQWTVLRGDLGVGNDERVPITNRFFQDIDALRGGGITYMSTGLSGAVYVFKLQQLHKVVRTGNATRAYDTMIESEVRGCVPRGGCEGIDQDGIPAVYFVDQNVGLCRFGVRGMEDLSQPRRLLFQRLNKSATVTARMLFYPKHWMVWVGMAIDGATTPSQVGCFNIRTRSWTDYTGTMGKWIGATLYPNAAFEMRPYVAPYVGIGTSFVCEADAGVDDDGTKFRGVITTRPYTLGGLYNKFGVMGAVLMARVAAALVNLRLIRNYGVEAKTTEEKSLAAVGAETTVVVPYDDAVIAECFCCQFELGDPASYAGAQLNQTWTLDELAFKIRPEDEGAG